MTTIETRRRAVTRYAFTLTMAVAVGGCSMTPAGIANEEGALLDAAGQWATERSQRQLPELSVSASPEEIVARAIAANGDIEAAWQEWNAAVARVHQAAAWPNTNFAVAPSFALSSKGSVLDRTSLGVAVDSMNNLAFPTKTRKAGEQALAQAQMQGQRYVAARSALRREVLQEWAQLAFAVEQKSITLSLRELFRLEAEIARDQVAVGAPQSRTLAVEVELAHADNAAALARVRTETHRELLAAMLALNVTALPLPKPVIVSTSRHTDDEALLKTLLSDNPDLAALAAENLSFDAAVELARLRWYPDLNPFAAVTGATFQSIGIGLMLPTTVTQIRASIREAEALAQASRATLSQTRHDKRAQMLVALIAVRDAERQETLYYSRIVPAAEALAENTESSWTVGQADLSEVLTAQRTVLESRLAAIQATTDIATSLAVVEELSGTTFTPQLSPQPSTQITPLASGHTGSAS
jgi:cobalt-zinc-cadmium efflux system outer membrane protein